MSGVDAVLDLAHRSERAVEVQLRSERVDDLLERGRDYVHALTALFVLTREGEGVAVDEGLQHWFERRGDELTQLVRGEAPEDAQAVLGDALHRGRIRPASNEQQL